ncbi:MAG TPA: alpha/beta hydrolase [Deltaproteobacteria bacterium]|jgi:pimeloyl-ACP methyl ester carboxylesterase|nr:alpha/beta hydrolase [Deltaproteobacteria bacterium]
MNPLSGRAIAFLPGLDGTGISFEPLAPFLPPDTAVRVVRYPPENLSFAETVQCAAEQVPPDLENAVVLAESFSGPVAVELAASGRIRAKCLVLCSTFARSPRPVLLNALRHLPLERVLGLPVPRFIFRRITAGGNEAADLFLDLLSRVRDLVPAGVLAHRLGVIAGVDVRHRLPCLRMPCLYIQAASDRSVPASCLHDFACAVPDLRVKRMVGPHFILQARPAACLQAIGDFVRLVEGRSVEPQSCPGG